MAPKKPLLEKMRQNPKDDWDINDIKRLCENHGVDLQPPSGSSHYKAVSPYLSGHQTVPYKRPIKPYYIKRLVGMIDAHIEVKAEKNER